MNKALFLDRDGVINVEREYVHRREDFCFQEGIFELCRAAQDAGYLLIVVTNQAGIGRGYFSEDTFLELTEWMISRFADQAVSVARVYYCPYHPIFGIGRYKVDSPDRKPKPGMLLRARSDFDLDLSSSILVGDTLSDIEAAIAAGVGTQILLRSAANMPPAAAPCHVMDSLTDIKERFFRPAPPESSRLEIGER